MQINAPKLKQIINNNKNNNSALDNTVKSIIMRNLALKEIVNNKNFAEFCELSGYDMNKIVANLGSSFAVELLNEGDEEYEDADMNYPYHIFNPFGLDIKAE